MHICPDIKDFPLQGFAELPVGSEQQLYFIHVHYISERTVHYKSTASSSNCHIVMNEINALCNERTYTKLFLKEQTS